MMGDRVNNGRFALAFLTSMSPLAMAGVLAPAAMTAPALGDVQSVAPYYAVVTDKAEAHCGPSDRFYRVGEVTTGQVVLVDGEGESWSRISYPSTLWAFARVEDVKVSGGTATLSSPSKLKAANAAGGYGGSWKALMDSPLPAGMTLKVMEPAKEGDVIVGYKITPPDAARCFVESHALRHASDAEVEAFKSKSSLPSLPSTPTKTETTPKPTTTPGTTPTGTTPGAAGPATATPSETPVVVVPEPKTTTPTPTRSESRAVASIGRLEEAFEAVWKQPVMTSEVGELMTEFQRAADKAGDNPELQKQLQTRANALKLRVDVRDKVRRQEEARAALNQHKTELEEEVANWEKSRVYTIVGELQPSTVYDGTRLPLMFRVVSVGGGSPRTLGYLKPGKDMDLTKMMGQVVGVIGDATLDRSLKLNIIDPVKVVTLKETQPTKTPEKTETPEKTDTQAGVEEKADDTPKKSGG
jgi:hypothetical protein